jgi:hypothetical protein
MKEVIENLKPVLMEGYPVLFNDVPLSQLPQTHPEVVTQNVLVEVSKTYMVNPIDVARTMFVAFEGQAAVLEARSANCGEENWNPGHRYMLRRLTLALVRYMDGPDRRFELKEVDECLFAVLILDDELLEEHPELGINRALQ